MARSARETRSLLDDDRHDRLVQLDSVGRTFSGPPRTEALKSISLTIRVGEYVAIMGPSGSGKTTLLNILGLLDRPSRGEYVLAGQNVSRLSDRHRTALRAQRIGFVFQAMHLLDHRTTSANVEMALLYSGVPRRRRHHSVREALGRVGLGHMGDATPRRMSGGERQRVAIARAIVSGPSLLLCDEPTGNLDSESSETVLQAFEGLYADGNTIIVVTHDPIVATRSRRVVEIRDGVARPTTFNRLAKPTIESRRDG